jgi:hypothetical protein
MRLRGTWVFKNKRGWEKREREEKGGKKQLK